MKWYWLAPKDQPHNNWILYQERPPVELRTRYQCLQCKGCGKIDENQALLHGIDVDVYIKARSDIVVTSDDLLCFSNKARQVYQGNGLGGLKFIELPGDPKYHVALPQYLLHVNLEYAEFQIQEPYVLLGKEMPGGLCEFCGRPIGGAYVGPLKQSFELPENPLIICAPSVTGENQRGKVYRLLVSEVVKNFFKSAHLSGVEYIVPL